MFPSPLFDLYGQPVTIYLMAMGVSYLVFLAVALLLGREQGLSAGVVLDTAFLGGALALVVGTGLVLLLRETLLEEMPSVWSFAQIAVLPFALALYLARHPATRGQAARHLDIFMPALIATQAVFRVGCLAAGCCHGKPAWGLPWAIIVDDPDTATLYRGIPVHPTQAYQIIANLAVLAVLLALRNRPHWQGKLLWVYLALYGVGRFVVEIFRGDPRPMVGPVTLNQAVCLLFLAVGIAGLRGWLPGHLWSGLGWRLRLVPQPGG